MNLGSNSVAVIPQNIKSQSFRSRVIAVASGKGGVGKTNLAVNLGISLARRGLRVALLDADLGTANVDVILGLQTHYHLHHVVTGQRGLADIMVKGPFGLQVIPGASGLPDLADLPQTQLEILLRALLVLDGTVDLLIIDTSAGVGREVVQFILAAGEMLLVTNPEPTAIADAYALMKVIAGYQMPVLTKLVVNNVRDHHEGEITGQRLAAVIEQFLGRQVEMMGIVPHDKSVVEAVKTQSPLLLSHPYSPMAVAINRLGERLWVGHTREDTLTGVARFFKRLLSFKSSSAPVMSEFHYANY